MKRNIVLLLLIILGLAAIFYLYKKQKQIMPVAQTNQPVIQTPPVQQPAAFDIIAPISNDLQRISKKPFGIYVKPGASPVNPERFTGFHTGTDFEAAADEQNSDVQISAVCTGKVLRKETARGYGGMVVQACSYHNEPITVVYGHIRLSSMSAKIGDVLTQGEDFVVLGKPYSTETGGERKHLHLGIHKGAAIDTRGYVQNESELAGWYDYQQIVGK